MCVQLEECDWSAWSIRRYDMWPVWAPGVTAGSVTFILWGWDPFPHWLSHIIHYLDDRDYLRGGVCFMACKARNRTPCPMHCETEYGLHGFFFRLSSYLSSMRTQRSLKCLCLCFFCLFLRLFFSIFFSAFSSSSRLSEGKSMRVNRPSSRDRPWSRSRCGSSCRKGSRKEDSSCWSSGSVKSDVDEDLLDGWNTDMQRYGWQVMMAIILRPFTRDFLR